MYRVVTVLYKEVIRLPTIPILKINWFITHNTHQKITTIVLQRSELKAVQLYEGKKQTKHNKDNISRINPDSRVPFRA